MNFVDPHGEFGFFAVFGALFASWVTGNVAKGFSQAFGIHTNVPLGGFSSNPLGTTDLFPPFLGLNFQDSKYPKEVWLKVYISWSELERRRREKLARLQRVMWGMSVTLSGGGRYGPIGRPGILPGGFASYLITRVLGELTGINSGVISDEFKTNPWTMQPIETDPNEIRITGVPRGPWGEVKAFLGKPFPEKLNRGRVLQPYDPKTGRFLPYSSNVGLKNSPFAFFTSGLAQGFAAGLSGAELPPAGPKLQRIGQIIGQIGGSIWGKF